MNKLAPTSFPIAPLIAQRWSARAIDEARPVSDEHLQIVLEAARWAPSCFGEQPWAYIVWNRYVSPEAWHRALACLTPKNQLWAKRAPILMASIADPIFRQTQKPNRWAQHDVGAASENLCLQAVELGLVAHQMGGFDQEKLKLTFNIPEPHICLAMIALGHPGDVQLLEAELREAELGPRKRKALQENFFSATWGAPISLP